MRRLIAAIRNWPASARVVAGALGAAVIALALTTIAEAGSGGGGHPTAPAGPAGTASTEGPGSLTAGATTSTSTSSRTSTTKAGSTTTASTTTTTARGATTTGPTTSTTSARATTTTAVTSLQNGNYCRASVSDPTPPGGASETVTVSSTIANASVTLVAHYKTGDVSYPGTGAPPAVTDGNGQASVTFSVERGSNGFPVVVEVSVKSGTSAAAQCETHFVPTS